MNLETRLHIAGEWTDSPDRVSVERKFDGELLGEVSTATPDQVDRALASLVAATADTPSPYERFRVLAKASEIVEQQREQLREIIIAESGFTYGDADGEINRAVQTLRLSGEEATRLTGEMVPMDGAPGVENRIGFTVRKPVGVVAAITPFNSPLNTVCHKVGPALAAGNTVALKPATYTPFTSAALVTILLEAGLPPSNIALLHGGGGSVGQQLLEDPRIAFYTFTGSTEVGRQIQRTIGLRRSQLELGSLSSTLICADTDLDVAVERTVAAAFRKAGQVCTSVQRLYVEESIYGDLVDAMAAAVEALAVGDPTQQETFVGPLISAGDASRVASWIASAQDRGASKLVGGDLEGRVVTPSVLTDVDPDMQVMCEEVFGTLVSVRPFEDLDVAISEINDTPFGLSAGIFTDDIGRAFRAADRLHMGSVHVNQTSSSRIDLMPYGGVKDSGSGHEGPKYAAREMTEERLITVTYG